MRLIRTAFLVDGIFGRLYNDNGVPIAYTLEHSYLQSDGTYFPKLNAGEHKCVRGTHQLHNGIPFETFEITGVPGHSNILFHSGNFNADSEGCILLGHNITYDSPSQKHMITTSKITFQEFMQTLENINEFQLTVENTWSKDYWN